MAWTGAIVALSFPAYLSAEDALSTENDEPPTSSERSDAISPTYSPISIAAPVGKISLAKAGDELGERRFEARSTAAGVSVVSFSRTRPRRNASGMPLIGYPAGLPLHNGRLSSGFGYRFHPLSGRYQPHAGVDLAAPMGAPVAATADGMVGSAGWMGGYGLTVEVDHGSAIQTRYAHLSAMAVSPGQSVKQGQIIGFVGSTGRSTGPHLHYEVRVAEVAIDPLP
ncbi:MAG: M23 family metallopeptidase [Alphaproteobacteria bacterium]|nr:M23 family metallopeptidase [Alphaproteobacteria bacterium]